jgi:type I restriction enzyme M protein
MSAMLKKSDLKKHLLDSVHILKRTLDYSVYVYFILAMLFFYHVGEIPYRGSLKSIQLVSPRASVIPIRGNFQKKKRDLQDDLIEAFSTVELIDPDLRGVLLPALPTKFISDATLIEYRQHLDALQQNTSIFAMSERFGQAYDYWISQLARMTVRRGTAFYTERSLIRLMVGLMKPTEDMSIYDPTAGTGGMLVEAAQYIRQQGGSLDTTRLFGREKSPDIWAVCKMNLLAHQIENFAVQQEDTLTSSQDLFDTFDLVLQNLPLPPDPQNKGQNRRLNTAFLQHAIYSLSETGRAAILAPNTILQQDQRDVWRYVVNRDWLEAVISLPPKLLHGTHAAACILIFNKKKSEDRNSQVLFIHLASDFTPRTRHSELQDEDIRLMIQSFETWGEGSDHARIIPVARIEEQDYSLRIEQYPDLGDPVPTFDLIAGFNRYLVATRKREQAVKNLITSLEELNYSLNDSGDENL